MINNQREACEQVDSEDVSNHYDIKRDVSGFLDHVKNDQCNNNLTHLNVNQICFGAEDCSCCLFWEACCALTFRGAILVLANGFVDQKLCKKESKKKNQHINLLDTGLKNSSILHLRVVLQLFIDIVQLQAVLINDVVAIVKLLRVRRSIVRRINFFNDFIHTVRSMKSKHVLVDPQDFLLEDVSYHLLVLTMVFINFKLLVWVFIFFEKQFIFNLFIEKLKASAFGWHKMSANRKPKGGQEQHQNHKEEMHKQLRAPCNICDSIETCIFHDKQQCTAEKDK